MSRSITTSVSIEVEHVTIESARSIAEVGLAFEAIVPQGDTTVPGALQGADQQRAEFERRYGPKLAVFLTRNHGRLVPIRGNTREACQYEIGNPITAASMIQHRTAARLYCPLRVALHQDDRGLGVFEYDRPASLFGQFGDVRAMKVARELDESLEDILERAAG